MKNIIILLFVFISSLSSVKAGGAKWITTSESQSATNTWISFRKDFILDTVPEQKVIARVAADSKYWLWLNGKLVVLEGAVKRGPNPDDTYFDEVDFTPYLNKGKNSVSILLWYFGKHGFSYNPSGMAALFLDCCAISLQTDKSWRSILHPAFYTPAGEYPNFRLSESNIGFDARKEMNSWIRTEDDTHNHWPWASSKELGKEGDKPWNNLKHRIIPFWKDFGLSIYTTEEVKKGIESDTFVCCLPYNAQIHPYFEVESVDEGHKIKILTDLYRGGGVPNVFAEYITRRGIQQFECLGWMNGQHVYYIVPHGVNVKKLLYRQTGYDTELSGSFYCNDPFYNRIWEKAQRTLYITMRDTYMDCPDRERAQWWGDVVNESGEAFYALSVSSHALTKKGMYELIGWQKKDGVLFAPVPASNYCTELPAQMLASIGYYGFWNYYLNTGDKQTIADLYPGVKKYMNIWQYDNQNTVIFRAGDWNWGDWGDNVDLEALMNAWYYIALQGQRNMAELLKLTSDVEEIDQQLSRLKVAFNKRFWNGKAYKDPDFKGVPDDRVQALAVLSGLAGKEKYKSLFLVLKTTEYASPYMEKYVLEALFKMQEPHYAMLRMKKRFSEMVNDSNHSTLFEGWGIGPNGFGGGTTNHAWSGGALTLLSQYVCGVKPILPGFESFNVKPMLGPLSMAQTRFESVNGDIEVSIKDLNGKFFMEVLVPNGTSAIVGVPQDRQRNIRKNGIFIAKNEGIQDVETGHLLFEVGAGKWIFESAKN